MRPHVLEWVQREWDIEWATTRAGRRALTRWAALADGHPVARFETLEQLVRGLRTQTPEVTDPVLRVMIPFVTGYVNRYRTDTRFDIDDVAAEALAVVYHRVAVHDLAAHGTFVAGHIWHSRSAGHWPVRQRVAG